MDRLTKEQRSKNMKAVKSKNSKIETMMRKALWNSGIRYRKNDKNILGKPDINISKYRILIFCDSEFWHGYNWELKKNEIKSNREFWINKIESNIKRDKYVNEKLREEGWIVLRFWGNDIKKNLDVCLKIIKSYIELRKNI